jgi:hypothetical protein
MRGQKTGGRKAGTPNKVSLSENYLASELANPEELLIKATNH